jgi:hypothetical protein
MSHVVGRNFIADGSAINVDLGFVPDYILAVAKFEETNPVTYEWWRERANTANGNGQFGTTRPANGGAVTKNASAAAGFAEYDTSTYLPVLPAPNGSGEQAASSIADYSTTTTYTARSGTALGSVVRPTTHNGFVYECTTASGGAAGTEPTTWGTLVGGTTTAGSGDVWTCRDEKMKWIGAKGITIGASLSTDSDEWQLRAEKWDDDPAERDAAVYDPVGRYPNN